MLRSAKRINVAWIVKHNPNAFYAYGNERRVIRDSIGPLRNKAGALKSYTEMSNRLNDYLVRLFTNEDVTNIPEIELDEKLQLWENINFTVNEV